MEVKAASARALMEREFRVNGLRFRWEEVFERGPSSIAALEHTGETTWLKAVPEVENALPNAWDWAHAFLTSDLYRSSAGGEIVAVEPNTIRNPVATPAAREMRVEAADCTPHPQDGYWATRPEYAWHLGDAYTQLATARARVSVAPGERRVRVAVLDTGYDPTHETVPKYLRRDLGWNFMDGNDDTTDHSDRFLIQNYGHGTGVISLLAGKARAGVSSFIGGAPEAEVVPIVPASTIIISDVVLDKWAKSFEWAIVQSCDLICMSAGGVSLVSDLIARAVNDVVDREGIGVFAAVGNHIAGIAHEVVMPARFANVIGVTGACADYTTYFTRALDRFSANWGPDSVMNHVLTVFSPNIPRARIGCPSTIDHDGWGTSQCAPQATAAAALWLQMHGRSLPKAQRAPAVYNALIATADTSRGNFAGWGKGFIRANDALNHAALTAAELEPLPLARIEFPEFDAVPALQGLSPVERRMFVVEACQLSQGSAQVQTALGDGTLAAALSPGALLDVLPEPGRASLAMRQLVG